MFAKRQLMLTAVTLALLMNVGVDAHATAQEAAEAITLTVNRAVRRLDKHEEIAKTDKVCDAALDKANTLTGETPTNCNVKKAACPTNCTALFTNMNDACYGKGVEDSEKKVEMYSIGVNAAVLELFLDKGVCKDAPSVAALKSKHLTCEDGLELMGSQSFMTCGSSDDGTEVCTDVCKQTMDKVYEMCDSTHVSTDKDGEKTTIEVSIAAADLMYSKDCKTYLGGKKFKDAAAPSPASKSAGSSTHVLSTVLIGVAVSAATYML